MMFARNHKALKYYFSLSLVLFLAILMIFWVHQEKFDRENLENCWTYVKINCGEENSYEVLSLPQGEALPYSSSVMLMEGQFQDHLSPRMMCAIESAAKTNSNATINVLMTSGFLKLTPNTLSVKNRYKNIKFIYLNSTKLFLESPLKDWFLEQTWKGSRWPKTNFNDALRLLVLWKFGGAFLDLDVVVFRNLLEEDNYAILESKMNIGTGILRFMKGHPVLEDCLIDMAKNFKSSDWGAYGPKIITKIFKKRCGMKLPSGKTSSCPEIKVYQPNKFYPIKWQDWNLYFTDNKELSRKILQDPETLGIHLWNFMSHIKPILMNESSPYAVAAREFCPLTVNEVGERF